MVQPTRVLLSDLDDTLFDHAHASRSAQRAVAAATPAFGVWSPDELERRHRDLLDLLHLEVLAGRLSVDDARIERFRRLLEAAGAEHAARLAIDVARAYRRAYETSWQPVPGALALLQQVRRVGLPVVIVTNNIVDEQKQKLALTGLEAHVDVLVTSEEAGIAKPAPEIFHGALARVGVAAAAAVMLGDAWNTDIAGALAAGIRPVWLNRFGLTALDPDVETIGSLEPTNEVMRIVVRS